MVQIWYYNVPHTKLAELKGHQNWVKVEGEYLTFPGGGTQFKNGARHYIDFIQNVSRFLFAISLLLQGPFGTSFTCFVCMVAYHVCFMIYILISESQI